MIKIFVTGGTFDKDYDEKKGRLYFKSTHMNEILTLGRSKVEVDIETLMMLDSLDIKVKDRKLIVEKCRATIEEQIVITHGTYTMTNTAKVLGAKHFKKTIVITGAMIHAQLDILNRDFSQKNEDNDYLPNVFENRSVDTQIRFCLAKQDENGYQKHGIVRKSGDNADNYYIKERREQ